MCNIAETNGIGHLRDIDLLFLQQSHGLFETDVPDEMLGKLTLFIDMTIIEYVTDEFECSAREGELPEEEDIGNAAYCLIHDIPYGGFGGTRNE